MLRCLRYFPLFEDFLTKQEEFAGELGLTSEDIRRYEHPKEKLSHYSRKTVDIEFDSPFGENTLLDITKSMSSVRLSQLNHIGQFRNILPDDPNINSQWQWINNGNGAENDADVDAFYDCDDEQECDWLLDYYENCVVEVDPDGTISWYEGEF